jgi:choline-sulfatase
MFGTYLADHAAAFLARPRTRPFFLYVSFHETHSPFNFPAGCPTPR